jgi:squalene synthase HpnD
MKTGALHLQRNNAAVRASGSSFYLAMRILGRQQRQAMFEVYSFCRAVDDIADGNAPREWRLAQLAEWRDNIDALFAGDRPPGLDQLADAIDRFGLRKQDFSAVIDGMEMDATRDICAPDLASLELYCDRVACAVGRLSVRIFGLAGDEGRVLAHHLGLALQLTNILRDIDEDAALGRLYLPREALREAGMESNSPGDVILDSRIGGACGFLANLARNHFVESQAVMAECPRQAVKAPRIMAEAYRNLLDNMAARGWSPPRARVRVNKSRLIWTALRHAFD